MNLAGADLSSADLSDAKLIRADLGIATLEMAVMRGADLSGARLGNSVFSTLNLRYARCDDGTELPDDWSCVNGEVTDNK